MVLKTAAKSQRHGGAWSGWLVGILFLAGVPAVSKGADYVAPFPFPPPSEVTGKVQAGPVQIETGYAYDALSNNQGNWQEYYLSGQKVFSGGDSVYGTARTTSRFGLADQEILVGGNRWLGKGWLLNLQGSFSGSHQVLPQWTLAGEVNANIGPGTNIMWGADHMVFNLSTVNVEHVGVERYWGNLHAAYDFYMSQLVNPASSGTSHAVNLDYYYTDRDSLDLAFGFGREAENIGNNAVLFTNTRSVNLYGRHWLDNHWGISYGIGLNDQNPVYTRRSMHLGLSYQFE